MVQFLISPLSFPVCALVNVKLTTPQRFITAVNRLQTITGEAKVLLHLSGLKQKSQV